MSFITAIGDEWAYANAILIASGAGVCTRFLLRPQEVEVANWQLGPLGPEEAPLALEPGDLVESGVFGVGVQVVHHLVRRRRIRGQKP